MELHQLLNADVLDIIFDGRNKAYGAYDLRKTYDGRLIRALLITGGLCSLLLGGYALAKRFGGSPSPTHVEPSAIVTLTEVNLQDKKTIIPHPQLPPPRAQKIETTRDVTTRIVPDIQVKPEDERPPENKELDNARIGMANMHGDADNGGPAPGTAGNGLSGVVAAPQGGDDLKETVFRKVEIESTYPGGFEAWRRFLIKNFRYPEQADDVQGTVIVEFIVDRQGNVSNVEALSGPVALRDEAVRVIRKSGKWSPGIQNGNTVSSYKRQPIVVQTQQE